MNIKAISYRLLQHLANIFFLVFFVTSFSGTFYEIFADKSYFVAIPIGLIALFFIYFFYILQHSELEFMKRGKGFRFILFLLALINALVQVTGGSDSILFPLYYFVVLFAVYRYTTRIAYYIIMGIALLEYGSIFFIGSFSTSGVLFLIKMIFLILIVLILNVIMSNIRRLHNRKSHYALQPSEQTKALDSMAHLVPHLESDEMTDMDQELFNTLTSVLSLVSNIFHPYTCGIFHYNTEKEAAYLYVYKSTGTNVIPHANIKPGEGLVGLVLSEHQPVIINNFKQDARTLRYYDNDTKIKSFLGAPLLMNNKLEGTLIIDSLEENAFTSEDQGVLINFCSMVSSFIYKSRLMLNLKESTENLSEFYEITKMLNSRLYKDEVITLLTDVIGKMFSSDRLALCMFDDSSKEFTIRQLLGDPADMPQESKFPLADKGCISWVFKHHDISIIPDLSNDGRPIPRYRINEDSEHGFRSFMGIPILIEHELIGVLCLESRMTNKYSQKDRERVTTVMNIATMALAKAQLYQRMENLATVDGLTNLANHRHFLDMFAAEILRAKRHKLAIAILMIDIDYFKQINDNHGHQTGDYILVEIARIFKATVREVDFVARYGGEKFALILVGDTHINALLAAERIRENIAQKTFKHEHSTLSTLTISIGISQYPLDSEIQSELIGLADKALYLAKESGRDCIKTTRDLNKKL